MDDLISRRAVIDAVLSIGHVAVLRDGDAVIRMSAVKYVLRNLPSVEPDIPRCKNCEWWTKQEDSLQGRCARYGFYPTAYWYCAAAIERKIDG